MDEQEVDEEDHLHSMMQSSTYHAHVHSPIGDELKRRSRGSIE